MSENARAEDSPGGWRPLPDGWRDRFVEILRRKAPKAERCARCGTGLTLAEDAITPAIWKGGAPIMDQAAYPQAMMVCENCGDTSYFNLVTLGIFDQEPGDA